MGSAGAPPYPAPPRPIRRPAHAERETHGHGPLPGKIRTRFILRSFTFSLRTVALHWRFGGNGSLGYGMVWYGVFLVFFFFFFFVFVCSSLSGSRGRESMTCGQRKRPACYVGRAGKEACTRRGWASLPLRIMSRSSRGRDSVRKLASLLDARMTRLFFFFIILRSAYVQYVVSACAWARVPLGRSSIAPV
ncbi:hypothetical protein GGR52DRAFT_563453 [Hypoxylon sp. FL1284]|nr:hypothetical protein GGR52DRAFT_563453 [Hypoxylon sp. FL1284]